MAVHGRGTVDSLTTDFGGAGVTPLESSATTTRRSPRIGWGPLWRRARPDRGVILTAIGLGLLGVAVDLAQPIAAREVITIVGEGGSLRGPVLILIALVVVGALIAGVHYFLLERTAEKIARRARVGLGAQLLRLHLPDLQRYGRGELLSRMSSDTTLLRTAATSGIAGGINGVVSLIGSIVLMAIVDWPLLLVTLGVLTVVLVGVVAIVPRIGVATRRAQEAMGTLGSTLERALGGIRTVKASGAEARETALIENAAVGAYGQGVTVARLTAVTTMLAGVGLQIAFLAVLGAGGARVADGSLSVGSLVAFLLYLFYLAGPLTELTLAATQLQTGSAAVARLDEIEMLPVEEVADVVHPASAPPPPLAFEHVTFRYGPGGPVVLRDLSFTLPGGGLTAIVGGSGGGKTTVFGLLERFYRPEAGRITLNGRDIAGLSLPKLRSEIGYVEQDCPLLAGTLRDNLVYGAPHAGEDEIAHAIRLTALDAFVAELPRGLDTRLGEGGAAVSGGERQRIAIARALLRAPRVLLLDEATSQLDAITERRLRETFELVARSCTVLVIAHRRSTVVNANRVILITDGRCAVGTHDELHASNDHYRELVQSDLVTGEVRREGDTRPPV
jgi:ABC-type multidrug transport system fused ATPase/permease subunit